MKIGEIKSAARESLRGKWGDGAGLILVYLFTIFVISFLLGLIPFVGSLIDLLITPVLSFGILVSFIKLSRNQKEASFFSFLKNGFNSFGKVWSVTLQILVRMLLPLALLILPSILTIISSFASNIGGDIAAIIFLLINIIIMPIAIIWLIIKSYSFILSLYILNDEPELSASEIVNKSVTLMKGNKFKLFLLELSFIGWAILSILTLGIGLLWLIPYAEVASVKFYEDLISSNN